MPARRPSASASGTPLPGVEEGEHFLGELVDAFASNPRTEEGGEELASERAVTPSSASRSRILG